MPSSINSGLESPTEDIRETFRGCLNRTEVDKKTEVIDKLPEEETLLWGFVQHVNERIELHPKFNDGKPLEYPDEKTALAELEIMCRGWLFEEVARAEYSEKYKQEPPLGEISNILMDVCRNPRRFGLPQSFERRRIPDGIYARFNEGTLQIAELVEATSGNVHRRKLSQLDSGEEGSRATMQDIITEINKQIKTGEINPHLVQLAQTLGDRTMEVDDNFAITLVVCARQHTYDAKLPATERKEAVHELMGSKSDAAVAERLLQILDSKQVSISYSDFSKNEITEMSKVVLEKTFDELKSKLIVHERRNSQEKELMERAEAHLRLQLPTVYAHYGITSLSESGEELSSYFSWLTKVLPAREVNAGKEIQKNLDGKSNIHRPTGLARGDGSNKNEEFGELLNLHVYAWKLLLQEETGGDFSKVTRDQIIKKLRELEKE